MMRNVGRGSALHCVLVTVLVLGCRPAPQPAAAPVAKVAAADRPSAAAPEPARAESLAQLERIGVMGASVSAGFGESAPLHRMLQVGLAVPGEVFDASSSAMFLRAEELGHVQQQIMRLRGVRVVVAVDFLFWFAYGEKSVQARHADLELGLRLLDALSVPIFVGDLPDVRDASPQMISPRQIPTPEELAELNARIRAWAGDRGDVHLLPMAGWLEALRSGSPPRVGGEAVDASEPLLQWDGLHPTAWGQAVLAALVLEEVRAALPGLGAEDLVSDPMELLRRYRDAQGLRGLPPGQGAVKDTIRN